MQSLLHSPILQALGYAIINSLWQFALLWLLYFVINTIFKLSTHQKYTTGIVLEMAGFVWFVETVHFYYGQSLLLVQNHLIDHRLYLPGLSASTGTLKQQFFLLVLRSEQFFPYLSLAYLTLLVVLTFRWMYAYTYTQRVRYKGLLPIDDEWNNFVQNLSQRLGIKRTVSLFLSDVVQTPLTVGFLKPLILVPVATVNYLTPQQLEAVLLHEIAHIKRYDYLFNLILALIEAFLFFNPFLQLLHQQIKKERENCCDDWVLKYDYNAASYARALLEIASRQHASTMFALNATDGKRLLINRIKRIIEKNERTFFNYKHQLLALLVMTIVLSSLSFLSPAKKGPVKASLPVQSNIIFEPMAAKVRNPLFNPVFFLATPTKIPVLTRKKDTSIKTGNLTKTRVLLPHPVRTVSIEPTEEAISIATIEPPTETILPAATPTEIAPATHSENTVTIFSNKTHDRQPATVRRITAYLKTSPRIMVVPDKREPYFDLPDKKENKLVFEKVQVQIRKALSQIKLSRQDQRMNIERITNQIAILDKQGEKQAEEEKQFKKGQLFLLQKQLEEAIDSIRLITSYTTTTDADFKVDFHMPAVVYSRPAPPQKHSYSYEFSSSPTIRVVGPAAPKDCPSKPRKEKQELSDDYDDLLRDEWAVPPAPAAAPKSRSLFIIRI